MSDHDDIRNLLGRYSEAIDAGDLPALADLFQHATLARNRSILRNPEDMISDWRKRMRLFDGKPRTRHITVNSIIEVDDSGHTARARSGYVVFQATDTLPLQVILFGRYVDEFMKTEAGEWAFKNRDYFRDEDGDLSHHLFDPGK